MSEENSNTVGVARVLEDGDLDEIKTILGDREKVRHSGIIRPGIKVPKASCSAKDKALYEKLYAQDLPFNEIDRQMGGEPMSAKSKLRPSNCDYFTIRSDDFKRPSDAKYIIDSFADDDGHVRRVPIWFHIGELHKIIPHNFRSFTSGGIRASSYFEGENIMCRYVPKEIQKPSKNDWQTRPCDANNCNAYASKKCKFGGAFKVNIPGIKGIGEVWIPTNSWNGLADAIANLKRITEVFGRFNGLYDGNPFLELCKVQEVVNTPDGKKKQWIITIEPSVDLMELARHRDPVNVMARATSSLNLLQGGKKDVEEYAPEEEMPTVKNPSEEINKIIEAFKSLAERATLAMDQIRSYVENDFTEVEGTNLSGVDFEDMGVDELKIVYAEMLGRLKKDKDEFIQYVCDVHSERSGGQMTGTDDLPDFGN